MDRYPDNLFEQIRALTARVELLEAQQQQRPGVTKASLGWLLADMSVPVVPSGHVHIGSAGGDFFAALSDGTVKRIPDAGVPVSNPPNFQSGTASGEDAVVINQLRADAAGTKIALDETLSSLRGAGLIEI